jgi:hypothetical protein
MVDISSIEKCSENLCKQMHSTYKLSSGELVKLDTPLNKLKIMGSYASYSSTGSYYSTSSYYQLKKNILLQNRFLHLDVDFKFDKGNKIPIVKGDEEQNEKVLTFKECCECIQKHAFNHGKLSEYPLILFINLKYDKINIDISNKIANILIKHFADKWPDIKYKNGFKGGNLATEPIGNFMGKIIILTNYDDEKDDKSNDGNSKEPRNNGRYLNELTHSYVKTYENLINITEPNINFIRLNFHNKPLGSEELSVNQRGNINDYLKKLENKFIIAFPTFKNNKFDILKLFNLDISNKELNRYNVVLKLFHPIKHTNNKKYDLLKNNMRFFIIADQLMPIRGIQH